MKSVPLHLVSNRNEFVAQLCERYDSELRRFLCQMLPTESDASDIAQEAYTKLYRLCAVDQVRNGRALLFRTAINLAIDWLTRSRRTVETGVDPADLESVPGNAPSPERSVGQEQELHQLFEVIKELSPRRMQILVMHKVLEMSYKEIAKELGISCSTIEQHMTLALRHCRKRLKELDWFVQ